MTRKAVLKGILAGLLSCVLVFVCLSDSAERYALELRQKWPEAWFSGLITFYALILVIAISLAAGAIACRMVYKRSRDRGRES